MKLAVLFRGAGAERDVLSASAAQIIAALRGLGHQVFAADTAAGRLAAAQEQHLLSAAVSLRRRPPASNFPNSWIASAAGQ